MSMVLDPPRTDGDPVASAAALFIAESTAVDLEALSIPELDVLRALLEKVKSFSQGRSVQVAAQRAKLVEAGRPKPKPGAEPEKPEKPLPASGTSRAEQARDAAATRGAQWAPSFGEALTTGAISLDHIVALSRVKNHADIALHESALLTVARMRTAEDFAKHLVKWDAERDHDHGIDRASAQRAKRRVWFDKDSDGLNRIIAALPLTDAQKVENTLRQIANELFHATGDDGTTLAQRLADALVLMADRAVNGHDSTKSSRPTLVVICDEDSLRGRLEDAGLGHTLDGHPVPASELRRIACDADILPAVMNSAGQILDFGRSRRTASDTQRLALLTMYGGCIIDGCNCPTQLLDIHHLQLYEHGGCTDLHNLAPLCKSDHTRSHAEKWTSTRGPDGHLTITTRNGQVIPTRRARGSDVHRAERASPDHARPDPPPTTRTRASAPRASDGWMTASLFDSN